MSMYREVKEDIKGVVQNAQAKKEKANQEELTKRQRRIAKHSWDRDEYWFIAAVLLLIAIKLFWH